MSSSKLAPWAITVAAVAVAVASWSGPVVPNVPQKSPISLQVAPPAPVRVDEAALAEIVNRAVREALAGHAPPSAPESDRSVQAAAEGAGLDLVEDVIARGDPTPDDRAAVRAALSHTDRAGADAILSAWATAINRGDIRIPTGQPPL